MKPLIQKQVTKEISSAPDQNTWRHSIHRSINNTSAINLDSLVSKLIRDRERPFSDIMEKYALETTTHLETDVEEIQELQKIYTTIENSSESQKLVLNPTYKEVKSHFDRYDPLKTYESYKSRFETFKEYLSELVEALPSKARLKAYKSFIQKSFFESKEFSSIEELIKKIKKEEQFSIELEYYKSLNSEKEKFDHNEYLRNFHMEWPEKKYTYEITFTKEYKYRNSYQDIIHKFDNHKFRLDIKDRIPQHLLNTSFRLEYSSGSETATIINGKKKIPLHLTKEEVYSLQKICRAVKAYDLNEKLTKLVDNKEDEFNKSVRILQLYSLFTRTFKDYETTMPTILGKKEQQTEIKDLRHPLLEANSTPNDVHSNKKPIHIITGPHKKTKSIYLEAIGLAHTLAQAGLPVFAKEATISVKDYIFALVPDRGNINRGESRHSLELQTTRTIAYNLTPHSLLLLDEPYTGTDPDSGIYHTQNIIDLAAKSKATTYIATHFSSIATKNKDKPEVNCLQATSNYKLKEGISEEHHGIKLAEEMGADREGLFKLLKERGNNK